MAPGPARGKRCHAGACAGMAGRNIFPISHAAWIYSRWRSRGRCFPIDRCCNEENVHDLHTTRIITGLGRPSGRCGRCCHDGDRRAGARGRRKWWWRRRLRLRRRRWRRGYERVRRRVRGWWWHRRVRRRVRRRRWRHRRRERCWRSPLTLASRQAKTRRPDGAARFLRQVRLLAGRSAGGGLPAPVQCQANQPWRAFMRGFFLLIT